MKHYLILLMTPLIAASSGLGQPSMPGQEGTESKLVAKTRGKITRKWLTGDWHQHTFFTDGSNFMGDVEIDFSTTPPTFQILKKYKNAPPTFTPVRSVDASGKPVGKNEYKGGMAQGFRYGLDFQANSEHGGNRGSHDGFGRFWKDTAFYRSTAGVPLLGDAATYNSGCSYAKVDDPACPALDPPAPLMWRWQELANYPKVNADFGDTYLSAFDWITTLRRQFRNKEILTGMEWNVPGHEHASTGCLENNGECIAEFEYRFDQNDTDMTGPAAAGMTWNGKIQTSAYTTANGYKDYATALGLKPLHEKTMAGLAWLNDNHPTTSWVNPAHIERAGCGTAADSGYSVAALRDMNNVAPSVFFGFEGMPGHQKASNRGEIAATSCGGGTFGGAGAYIATVGGVWDNLLADGRKIFNFVSSDFHITRDDFYPGEYAKTYVNVADKTLRDGTFTQQDILDGLRSGESFAVHGDLINELDFNLSRGVPTAEPGVSNSVAIGGTLPVYKGESVTVEIRFKSPAKNNCRVAACAAPVVHHIQLIQGRVNSSVASKFLANGDPNPAFNAVDPTVASIVKTFDATSWTKNINGYTSMTFVVPNVQGDMFFRIRGTNLGYGVSAKDGSKVVYGTDNNGSPILNPPGANSETAAWQDLWFYSNPIFVSVVK